MLSDSANFRRNGSSLDTVDRDTKFLPPAYVVLSVCLSTGRGGYPISGLGRGGTPSQVWVGGGTPYPISGLGGGGTPSQVGGVPVVPPPPGIASTCYGYAAGSMPLAFTQEDFLV